jgi:hypothetical protein
MQPLLRVAGACATLIPTGKSVSGGGVGRSTLPVFAHLGQLAAGTLCPVREVDSVTAMAEMVKIL